MVWRISGGGGAGSIYKKLSQIPPKKTPHHFLVMGGLRFAGCFCWLGVGCWLLAGGGCLKGKVAYQKIDDFRPAASDRLGWLIYRGRGGKCQLNKGEIKKKYH